MIGIPRSFRVIPINRLHTATVNNNKNAAVLRQVKILRKLLGTKESGSKKRWYPSEGSPENASFSGISKTKKQGKNSSRRVTVLNKLFMKNVTDLLATGEISEAIVGKGLEISRVKVTSDFQGVNVFWIAKGTSTDNEIESTLSRCAGILRHELSQLRLMGEVPRIHFVKDKIYANIAEVQNILQKCDFGDDIEISNGLQHDFNINIHESENEESLPVMRQDVLGLNRDVIMDKILGKMKKSKDAWEKYELRQSEPVEPTKPLIDRVTQQIAEATEKEQRFEKYLQHRAHKRDTPERKKFFRTNEYVSVEIDDDLQNKNGNKDEADYIEEYENTKR